MKHFVVNEDFVVPPISAVEAEVIFGPMGEEEEIVFTQATDMETLAKEAGIFPSKGQARKNGFAGPIPFGLSLFGTKKITRRFWVWNPATLDESPTIKPNFDHTDKWFEEKPLDKTDQNVSEVAQPSPDSGILASDEVRGAISVEIHPAIEDAVTG